MLKKYGIAIEDSINSYGEIAQKLSSSGEPG